MFDTIPTQILMFFGTQAYINKYVFSECAGVWLISSFENNLKQMPVILALQKEYKYFTNDASGRFSLIYLSCN